MVGSLQIDHMTPHEISFLFIYIVTYTDLKSRTIKAYSFVLMSGLFKPLAGTWWLLQGTRRVSFKLSYMQLFFLVFSPSNSTLKSFFKSTQVNFSSNLSESLHFFICKNVSNLLDCNFHDIDTLANIAENGCMQKKI